MPIPPIPLERRHRGATSGIVDPNIRATVTRLLQRSTSLSPGRDASSSHEEVALKVLSVVGARPNFMKIAPLIREMSRHLDVQQALIHTGQHYDANLSDVFFRDLAIPRPDFNLAVGAGSRDEQIIKISDGFERILLESCPDLVIVVGDVNSTIACAKVARKHRTRLAHVEAGLRSFDLSMPEELNRVETDRISDYLFVTEESGMRNLANESIEGKVFFVGNVMIDTLVHSLPAAKASKVLDELGVSPGNYMVGTFHRPSNVDGEPNLRDLIETIGRICERVELVLPLHPRTRKSLESHGLFRSFASIERLVLTEPLGYVDFLQLLIRSRGAITDSGGIQEESTYLGIPCLTMRTNTERPITLTRGTNTLVGTDQTKLLLEIDRILTGDYRKSGVPPLWDGFAASRIVDALVTEVSGSFATTNRYNIAPQKNIGDRFA
jgi:UDP-N-acetylglucosamine 2-epimerase (non-hydrolysing)